MEHLFVAAFLSGAVVSGRSPVVNIKVDWANQTFHDDPSRPESKTCKVKGVICVHARDFDLYIPSRCTSTAADIASLNGEGGVVELLKVDTSDEVQHLFAISEPPQPWRAVVELIAARGQRNVVAVGDGGLGVRAIYWAPRGTHVDSLARSGGVAALEAHHVMRLTPSDGYIAPCSPTVGTPALPPAN